MMFSGRLRLTPNSKNDNGSAHDPHTDTRESREAKARGGFPPMVSRGPERAAHSSANRAAVIHKLMQRLPLRRNSLLSEAR